MNKGNGLVIGLQYGDESKGRVSAYFCKDYEWSVRFSGGPNAGHTVFDLSGRKFAFHHLPAGIVYGKKIALDCGMVINFQTLRREMSQLGSKLSELYINENAHVIQREHLRKDIDGSGIGSTKRGIAYAYSDKILRKNERVIDYARTHPKSKIKTYKGLPPLGIGERALYESAQGIMLDVDYGCYPYVTSSSVLPSVAHNITRTIGVMKAYTSRVGDGPPYHEEEEKLTMAGDEFGTTTGRPRKCYWNDIDQLNYAISICRPDEIVVGKLDILDGENIHVWENNKKKQIGSIKYYKEFLLERFPQIKYFSTSPQGELETA